MVDVLWKPITVLLFLMEHAIVTAVFYLFALDCLATQKTVDETACCWKLCLFSPMDCYRRVSLPHVTRRFNPTLDKFGNPDTNLSVGLFI